MTDEVEILKYVENRLTEKQRIAFEERMKLSLELQESVQSMQSSFLPYAAAVSEYESHNDVKEAPEKLHTFFDEVSGALYETSEQNKTKKTPFIRYAQVASLAAVLFVVGFISNQVVGSGLFKQTDNTLLTRSDVPDELFEYMVIYQALYNRRTVESVSQKVVDTEYIVDQFNRENGLSIEVPKLDSHGYEFRRVQQLAYQGKPILQFVFLGKEGEPVAICVTPAKVDNQNIASMSKIFANMNTVSWGDSGSVFMLISKEPELKLNQIAQDLNSS